MTWGWLVAAYLFLGGAGAGAFIMAFALKRRNPPRPDLIAAGAVSSGILVALGSLLLVFDLGIGKAQPWRIFYLFSRPWDSVMSLGTWILTLFIIVALLYGSFFWTVKLPWQSNKRLAGILEGAGLILALGTACYTALLLYAVENAAPFWHNWLLVVLFFLSALSTGNAVSVLLSPLFRRSLPAVNTVNEVAAAAETDFENRLGHLVLWEAAALAVFVITSGISSAVAYDAVAALVMGKWSWYFWIGVVLAGLVLPLAVNLYLKNSRRAHDWLFLGELGVLVGGFMLRYLILTIGQQVVLLA